MSMINFVRQTLTKSSYPYIFIYRNQSQKMFDLFKKSSPVEIEINHDLENLPCENTIEWNKQLKTYRIRNEQSKALKLFEIGIRKHRFQPDYITYISMLELCKELKDVENGRYIHRIISNSSVKDNTRIQGLLLEMYIKGGDLECAKEMFDMLKHRTVVEFNALMLAYNSNHYPERTIELFGDMRDKYQIKPTNASYLLYFQACILLKSFEQGKALHEELKAKNYNYLKNKELANQIISMYLASGDYLSAEEYFKQIKEPSLQNYLGLMNVYNQRKMYENTLQLYEQLKVQRKIQADVSIYLAVLTACKQLKNLNKAKEIQEDLVKQNLCHQNVDIENLLKEIFS